MRRVYLDHSATTPVRPEVAQLVSKYFWRPLETLPASMVLGERQKGC